MDNARLSSRRVIVLITLAFFFVFLGPACVQVFIRSLVPADWSRVKVTSILAALYFSFMFWRLFVVATLRALGDRLSFALGLAAYLLVPLALLFTTNYPLLLLLAAIWGWGAASMWQTGPLWLYDHTSPARRGLWAGVIYAVTVAALFAGSRLLGLAADAGNNSLLLTLAILPGIAAVACAFMLPKRASIARRLMVKDVFSLLLERRVIILGALLFVSATSYGFLLGAFRDTIEDIHGPAAVGRVVSYFFLSRFVLSIIGGHFTDIFARRSVVAAVFCLSGVILASVAFSSDIRALLAVSCALGAVGALVPISATAYSADWFAPERRTLAMGAAFFWNDAGTAVALLAGQFLAGAGKSLRVPALAFAGLFVLSTLLALLIPATPHKHEEAS